MKTSHLFAHCLLAAIVIFGIGCAQKAPQANNPANTPAAMQPGNATTLHENPSPPTSIPAKKGEEVTGLVSQVSGSSITVTVKEQDVSRIKAGLPLTLVYVSPSKREMPVGNWKVTRVAGSEIKAERIDGIQHPKTGLKAKFDLSPRRETSENSQMEHVAPAKIKASGEAELPQQWIGVKIQDNPLGSQQQEGYLPVVIVDFVPESPAAKAGLKIGDYITHVGTVQVQNSKHLGELIRSTPKSIVAIRIVRNKTPYYIAVPVQRSPQ